MRSRNRKTPNKQTNHQINQFKNVYQINEKKIPLHQSKSLNFWPFPNTAKHSHETKKKYSTKKLQQTQLKFTLINCKKYHILLDCINFIRTQKITQFPHYNTAKKSHFNGIVWNWNRISSKSFLFICNELN
jgi:hypothetical protein